MYLKKMEIIGFKSFADKTVLEFGPGISMIVGPNGCGKSNVSDAIKWVLGEQSAKSLRSKQMSDVIFNGTQNRPAMGMAEVSLFFDNSRNVLPIDFSEVTVTRKIFRSGESEYFINNTPCRLKDIRDLFADTGIGADGYSIIEQGRAEFIINSKAEDRRVLFEEAAGISKYKIRKEEAMRKLERVQQDINRINDVLAFHLEQVKSLESAARKSRQFQRLKDELRRAEITQIVHRIDENRAKLSELQSALEPQLENRQKNITNSDMLLAEIEEIKTTLVEMEKKIIESQDEISKVTSRIEIADAKISQAEAMIATALEKIKSREDDIRKDSEEIEKLLADERALSEDLASLEAAVSEVNMRCDAASSSYEEVAVKFRALQSEQDEIKSRLWAFIPQAMEKSNQKSKAESDSAHLSARISRLKTEAQNNSADIKNLKSEVGKKISEEEELNKQKEELDLNYSSLIAEAAELEKNIGILQNRMAQLRQSISLIEGELNALEQFESSDPTLASIKAVSAAGLNVRGPLIDAIRVKQGYEKLAATLLGEKAYYMIAATEAAARSAIDFLSRNNLGSLTFVVEEKIPSDTPVNSDVYDYFEFAVGDLKILNYLLSSSRVEGETVLDGALIRGGGKIASVQTDMILQKQQKISLLNAEKERLEVAQRELAELEARRDETAKKIKATGEEKSQKEFALKWYQKEISQLRDLISEKENLGEVFAGEIAQCESDMSGITETIRRLGVEISELENSKKSLQDRLDAVSAEIEKLRPEEETRKKALDAAKAEVMGVKPRMESLRNNIHLINTRVSFLRSNIENNSREIENWRAEIESQKKIKSENAGVIAACQSEKTAVQSRLETLLNERDAEKSKLAALEANLQRYSAEKEKISEKIHQIELDIKTSNVEISSYLSRLNEEFGVDEETARKHLSESLLDAEEISKLRKKIESFGTVNFTAPEEYDALNKKYEFILAQKNDLEKAKSDLEEIISKINRTTKEQFIATFEKVRENFQSLFVKLFEGGQADLVLADKENVLEGGIEIIAQPPGKKLRTIEPLSGGEKALTAIALLFAFYLVKPAPFCLLDEVDAPLDESNVERYLNLLETFTDKSQFLMITHNKRSMLRADVMYGITMEEFGVSKFISLKFEKPAESVAV